MSENDAARALFVPFEAGDITLPPGCTVLWLNAFDTGAAHLDGCAVTKQQSFRPWAVGLPGAVADFPDGVFDVALVCGRKQQEENRALLAAGLLRLVPGGLFVAAAENDAGGRRLAKDLAALGVNLQADSKYHCRILWGTVADFDRALAETWAASAHLQQKEINGRAMWTRPGLFGWDKLDKGSEFLLAHLPPKMSGAGADLGCGIGVLSQHILAHYPRVSAVLAVDAEADSVVATARNIDDARLKTLWAAIGAEEIPAKGLDWVIMNPPFHQGSRTAIGEGLVFIKAAAKMLRPGGRLWMVANAHLPYEGQITTDFKRMDKIAEGGGFKIYCAVK